MKLFRPLFAFLFACTGACAMETDPFEPVPSVSHKNGDLFLVLDIPVPETYQLYGDMLVATVNTVALTPVAMPDAQPKYDEITQQQRQIITAPTTLRYPVKPPVVVEFTYQGCDARQCFLPQVRRYRVSMQGVMLLNEDEPATTAPAAGVDWFQGRTVVKAGGFLDTTSFLAFLDRAEGLVTADAKTGFLDNPMAFLNNRGILLTLLVVLLGGMLLNLTPCVLPMIPVNLAIIGAGGSSKARGFFYGLAYGSGMALVYGALGLIVVLTGGFFGALQASPWFNLAVAVVFIVLTLAMLDILTIDFSHLMGTADTSRTGFFIAMGAGGAAALLAGACVAPVVLAVLMMTGTLYAAGNTAALLLPFVLGAGMGLPWPLAGAGLAVLPRPGAWMARVKYGFAAMLVVMAGFYIFTAVKGFTAPPAASAGAIQAGDQVAWEQEMRLAGGKPVLVDFWATWCKNCKTMERGTLRRQAVRKRLEGYHVVKVQAERLDDEKAQAMLRAFGVAGLPGFAVLPPPAKPVGPQPVE